MSLWLQVISTGFKEQQNQNLKHCKHIGKFLEPCPKADGYRAMRFSQRNKVVMEERFWPNTQHQTNLDYDYNV